MARYQTDREKGYLNRSKLQENGKWQIIEHGGAANILGFTCSWSGEGIW